MARSHAPQGLNILSVSGLTLLCCISRRWGRYLRNTVVGLQDQVSTTLGLRVSHLRDQASGE